jgi:phosphoglycolate phosphatase
VALLVFDFDGTLVDSNALKRRAYGEAAAGIPQAAPHVERVLAMPGQGDRYWVMIKVAEALGRPEIAAELIERYEALTREGILARLADGWAAMFLDRLASRGHRAYVSSATPQPALKTILEHSGLASRLAGFRGGFGRKTENLHDILSAESAARATVVGDGADDVASAAACGCACIRVDDGDNALFRRTPDDAVAWIESRMLPPNPQDTAT